MALAAQCIWHTVNSGSEMVGAKHVSGKNICWSTCIGKSKERKIFDFLHCPFEPPAKQHRPVSQLGWILWCMLAWPSKGQCRNSKNFPPLLLTVKVDQNIFFPETCFASTISEPELTVCNGSYSSKMDVFLFFQIWRLAILEPVGILSHNVPHFKGLIVLYLDSRSSRAWHYFYLLSQPFKKGNFTP